MCALGWSFKGNYSANPAAVPVGRRADRAGGFPRFAHHSLSDNGRRARRHTAESVRKIDAAVKQQNAAAAGSRAKEDLEAAHRVEPVSIEVGLGLAGLVAGGINRRCSTGGRDSQAIGHQPRLYASAGSSHRQSVAALPRIHDPAQGNGAVTLRTAARQRIGHTHRKSRQDLPGPTNKRARVWFTRAVGAQ